MVADAEVAARRSGVDAAPNRLQCRCDLEICATGGAGASGGDDASGYGGGNPLLCGYLTELTPPARYSRDPG